MLNLIKTFCSAIHRNTSSKFFIVHVHVYPHVWYIWMRLWTRIIDKIYMFMLECTFLKLGQRHFSSWCFRESTAFRMPITSTITVHMNMNILHFGNNEKISYLWKSAVGLATLNLTKNVARTSATYKISRNRVLQLISQPANLKL